MTKVYVRGWREYKQLSQTDVANRIGVHKSEISRLEHGSRKMTHAWMDRLARAIGVSTTTLFEAPPEPPSAPVAEPGIGRTKPGPRPMAKQTPIVRQGWHIRQPVTVNDLAPSRQGVVLVDVVGDEMAPTLQSGDAVVVDAADRSPVPSGLFVIVEQGAQAIRRVHLNPRSTAAVVSCDNAHYPPYEIEASRLEIVGRVVKRLTRV